MGVLDTTALNAVLKTQYTQKKVNLLCYKNNPFYAKVTKRTDFVGANKVVAVRNASPQGRGAGSLGFTAGLANMSASVYNKFTVTRVSDYAFGQVTTEAIRASKNDAGSLVEGLKTEVDGAIYTCMRSLALGMYGNSGGARGQISSGSSVGTATITLANLTDVVNFEVGMILNLSAADGTSGSKRTGTVTLTGVDRIAGTLTASGNWTAGISAAATGDYIFQNGDIEATKTLVSGLLGWLPTTAPTSGDSFFGLDRSSDVTRLAGIRYSAGSGGPIEETLIDAAALVSREGGMPDSVFMNPVDYANLVKAQATKVVFDRSKSFDEPDIGFKALQLQGPTGSMDVIPDLNCPKGRAFMLQMDTWCFESLGAAPGILDDDGNRILRSATADSYIIRVGYFGNLTCVAPGFNANITL
jgi:hypothetical protein